MSTNRANNSFAKKDKWFWVRAIGTVLSIAALVWLLADQSLNEIWDVFTRISPISLVEMAILMVISRLAVLTRWYALIKSGGGKISYGQSVRISLAGLFATNFLPSTIGGDVVRLWGAIQLGIESSLSAASLIMDRLVGMFGMALVIPWSIPYLTQSAAAGVSPFSLAVAIPWKDRLLSKASGFLKSLLTALVKWIKKPAGLTSAFACTLVHMACFYGIEWLALKGMGEPLPFMTVGGLFALVYFVTLLPVSINGYGLQELSVTFVYSQLAGVSAEASLAAALILRTLTIIASLPGVVFLPGLLKKRQGAVDEKS